MGCPLRGFPKFRQSAFPAGLEFGKAFALGNPNLIKRFPALFTNRNSPGEGLIFADSIRFSFMPVTELIGQ